MLEALQNLFGDLTCAGDLREPLLAAQALALAHAGKGVSAKTVYKIMETSCFSVIVTEMAMAACEQAVRY